MQVTKCFGSSVVNCMTDLFPELFRFTGHPVHNVIVSFSSKLYAIKLIIRNTNKKQNELLPVSYPTIANSIQQFHFFPSSPTRINHIKVVFLSNDSCVSQLKLGYNIFGRKFHIHERERD